MTALPSVRGWPRSTPARSQQATATLLARAVDIAVVTSPGRWPSGRGAFYVLLTRSLDVSHELAVIENRRELADPVS